MSGGHPRKESSQDAATDTGRMQAPQPSPAVRLAALLGRNAARQWPTPAARPTQTRCGDAPLPTTMMNRASRKARSFLHGADAEVSRWRSAVLLYWRPVINCTRQSRKLTPTACRPIVSAAFHIHWS
jgi:hypothetical protein